MHNFLNYIYIITHMFEDLQFDFTNYIEMVITPIVLYLVYIWYLTPKWKLERYVKAFESRGYKVYWKPFQLFTFHYLMLKMDGTNQHGDANHWFKQNAA